MAIGWALRIVYYRALVFDELLATTKGRYGCKNERQTYLALSSQEEAANHDRVSAPARTNRHWSCTPRINNSCLAEDVGASL